MRERAVVHLNVAHFAVSVERVVDPRLCGRPVILATGHFGNYLAPRSVWVVRGHVVGGLYNPMKNPHFNSHYAAAMGRLGEPMFPRGRQGFAQLLKHLRGGGMIGMLHDQFMGHGEMLTFFGRPAPTALSAAELALKYHAVMVPTYGIRQPDGLTIRTIAETPLEHSDARVMSQQLNDSLEAVTRAHMEQWFWIHRRWKPERHAEILAARAG